MGMLLIVTPFRLWLLRSPTALAVAVEFDLLGHLSQELGELLRRHVPKAFPLLGRQCDHHPLIHSCDLSCHEVARELLLACGARVSPAAWGDGLNVPVH